MHLGLEGRRRGLGGCTLVAYLLQILLLPTLQSPEVGKLLLLCDQHGINVIGRRLTGGEEDSGGASGDRGC